MRVTFGWGFGLPEWLEVFPATDRMGLLDESRLSLQARLSSRQNADGSLALAALLREPVEPSALAAFEIGKPEVADFPTETDDVIQGTAAGDTINGLGGNDTLYDRCSPSATVRQIGQIA